MKKRIVRRIIGFIGTSALTVFATLMTTMMPVQAATVEEIYADGGSHCMIVEEYCVDCEAEFVIKQGPRYMDGENASLIAPTEVKWEKLGVISFIPQSDSETTELRMALFCNDAQVTTWHFGTRTKGEKAVIDISSSFGETGTYTAKVYVVPKNGGDAVYSAEQPSIDYVKPDKQLGVPTNLRWEVKDGALWAIWDKVENTDLYGVTPLENGVGYTTWHHYSNEYRYRSLDELIPGVQYTFRVYAMTEDITAYCNGMSSDVSPVYMLEEDPGEGYTNMYRLYNPNSGEHFYTANAAECNSLAKIGWRYEGVAWKAPASSNTPVYRLYNPNAGDHHYTTNAAERNMLIGIGWNDEGIGWYSDEAEGQPLYRLYNPNATQAGAHHYTTNAAERDMLVGYGWRDEGIGWYGGK